MKRLLVIVFALVILGCATTQTVSNPGGYTYSLKRDDTFKLELPVPEGWTAKLDRSRMERGTIVTYVVTAPNEDVILGITVMPPESTLTSQQVIEAARKKVSQAMPGGVSDVERSVGGRRLKGLLVVQGDDRMMIFCVDHLSRVYVVVLDIKNAASQAERDAADYMLDRLRFLDGQ